MRLRPSQQQRVCEMIHPVVRSARRIVPYVAAMAAVRQYRDALPQGAELLWYRIQEVLGQGTFGTTYLAEDLNDGRIVAIKEYLPPQVARRGEEQGLQPLSDVLFDDYAAGLGRFIAEAENLYRFDHPHIVRLVDLFEANNTAYLVMEYEEGRTCSRSCRGVPRSRNTRSCASCSPSWMPWRRCTTSSLSIATSSRATSSFARTAAPCSSTSARRGRSRPQKRIP